MPRYTHTTRCKSCGRNVKDLSRHLGNRLECKQFYDKHSNETLVSRRMFQEKVRESVYGEAGGDWDPIPLPNEEMSLPDERTPSPALERELNHCEETVSEASKSANLEYEYFPGNVADSHGKGFTAFEKIREQQVALSQPPSAPFACQDEWELGRYLFNNTTQSGIAKFLKLEINKKRTKPEFKTTQSLLKKLDSLPTGPKWSCTAIQIQGDRVGPGGERFRDEIELWHRDPVECVKDLIGNPTFGDCMSYAPIRIFKQGIRQYSEMSTSNWWWEIQGRLPSGAVVVPVILASDKTHLSNFKGDQTAWPVYLSIGNIAKSVRRKPTSQATVLIGYIPVSKLDCFEENTRSQARYRAFHLCMKILLNSLKPAGEEGFLATCADGMIRRLFAILAAYVADYPEQCLICCCKENRCPRCLVPYDERGSATRSEQRCPAVTKELLEAHRAGRNPPEFEEQGLRPIYSPFWAELPHTDIFASITPDVLHQLHKGVFKDHIVSWCTTLIGKEEIDNRFKAMTNHPDVRHFTKGISLISQWTGKEQKEMEKVFLGVIAGAADDQVVATVRALLDFIYYAQYHTHSELTIRHLENALNRFHAHKECFIRLGVRSDFNIPKLHSMMHYGESIRSLGCLDGVNTETSERLHIDCAKKAYRASNRRDYLEQMALWLQRQEAIVRKSAYLEWINKQEGGADEPDHSGGEDEASDAERDADGNNRSMRRMVNTNIARAYQVAVRPPHRQVSLPELGERYGAPDFLSALNQFLTTILRTTTCANSCDRFDVFKQITVLLPRMPHVEDSKRVARIRAMPSTPANGRRKPSPSFFDTALVAEDLDQYHANGGLSGLRAAQLRVIFSLPNHLGSFPHPLIYIHWFRPFRSIDALTGLHVVSHSTRNLGPNSAIVSADQIVRGCHLIPRFGRDTVDPSWTTHSVLDMSIPLFLNRYQDSYIFDDLASPSQL